MGSGLWFGILGVQDSGIGDVTMLQGGYTGKDVEWLVRCSLGGVA